MHVLPGPHELPLRGRTEETAGVRELVEAPPVPGSALLTFEGPPGIGKSRMLREAGRVAREAGYAVVNGLPEGCLPTDRPLAVLLDDLHCAGEEEARSLYRLRGGLIDAPVVWITARRAGRDHRPAEEILLGMAGYQERWMLPPLPAAALDVLAADFFGRRPGPALRRELAGAGGHPRLTRALMEGLVEERRIRGGAAVELVDGPVPARVSALVRSLTRGWSQECRRMVPVAAVLGPRIVFAELAHVLGLTPSELLPATEEAIAAGVLSADSRDLAFTGELLWRVLHDSVPPTVRAALRQQAAPQPPRRSAYARPAGHPASARSPRVRHASGSRRARTVHPARVPAGSAAPPLAAARADRPRAYAAGGPLLAPQARPEPVPAVGTVPDGRPGTAPAPATAVAPDAATAVTSARTGPWEALNERQRAIARLVIGGLTNRQIAAEIHLSPHTVNYHLRRMYQVLGIGSRIGLLGIAHTKGLP
ncbi:LuxR C-terminal-related transcriptional regulator [Streptomyces sp. BBFR2]|uniref:helix-turn-helix transcriptional regulator n=1 Tax=Streptomyces sp. BBFR2 TaxID=3372854 RepID=UPI0037D9B573